MPMIQIDDGNPFAFSSGTWAQFDGGSFNNTRSLTKTAGSTKVVRFVGTSITVMGGLQQYANSSSAPLVSRYSIDNGPPVTYAPASPALYATVVYYQSPSLPMGEHVLLMMNMVDNDLIWLDYFVIEAAEGGTPEILPSNGALIPQIPTGITTRSTTSMPPSTLTSSTMTATSKASILQLSSALNSTLGQTPLAQQTTRQSALPSLTSQETTTDQNTPPNIPPTYQPTVINYQDKSSQSPPSVTNKNIIAGVVGGLFALMLLIGAGMFVLHKRRQKSHIMKAALDPYITPTLQSRQPNPSSPENTLFESSLGENDGSSTFLMISSSSTPHSNAPEFHHISSDKKTTGERNQIVAGSSYDSVASLKVLANPPDVVGLPPYVP